MDQRQAGALAQLQERVEALERTGNTTLPAVAGCSCAAPPAGKPLSERPRRTYYDVVTADAEPGEELVYGDAAPAVL